MVKSILKLYKSSTKTKILRYIKALNTNSENTLLTVKPGPTGTSDLFNSQHLNAPRFI